MKAVVNRIVQYANRYQLTDVSTGQVLGTFEFDEVTGTVQQVGTEIDAELFQSIADDLAARVVSNGGELAGTIVTFSDISGTAANVASGDTSATLWGKVKNWFSRLKSLAFKNKVAAGDFEAGAIKNADVASDASIAQSKINGLESALAAKANDADLAEIAKTGELADAIQDGTHRLVTDTEKATWNAKQSAITGAASTIVSNNLTTARALVSDSSGKVGVSDVTATELGYLDGVKSNIQEQLDNISGGTGFVSTSPQTLTSEQQAQARSNIGAQASGNYALQDGTYPNLNTPKTLYNLGAYDTYVDNGDGTVTVTRKTGKYDVPIENFVIGEGCFQILNFSLPNTDKYFIIGGSSGSSEHATSNVYPLGAWGVDDTFYIPSDNYLRVFDSSYTNDATGLAQFKAALEAAGGMYILYETDTSYQEKLPANVPINTLDANMSDIVRDEVEKALNLYNHNNVSDFSGNVDASDFEDGTIDVDWGGAASNATINFNAKNGATFSCSLNSASGGYWAYNMTWLYKDGSSEQMTTKQVGTSGKFTFSSAAKEVIGIRLFVNLTWSASNVMINEGSHAYPYQPYNGAIVHEKQLNEALEDYLPLTGGTINGTINATGQVQEAGQRVYSPNNKPTKSDIGLGNVDNVQQYSSKNPPPYPVTSVNGKTGAVQVTEIGGVAFNKRSDGQIVDNNASTHYISQRVTLWSGSQRVTGVSNFHFTVPQQVFRELVIYGNVEGETGIRCIHVPAYYRGGGGEDTGFAQATYSWARDNILNVTNLDVYIDTAISAGRYQCHISAHTGVLISASGVASSLTPIIVQLVEGII